MPLRSGWEEAMNAATRKNIAKIIKEAREALSTVFTQYGQELRDLGDGEQEKFDNLSEGLQAGEGGRKIEAWADALRESADAADEAQDAIDRFEGALQALEELM